MLAIELTRSIHINLDAIENPPKKFDPKYGK